MNDIEYLHNLIESEHGAATLERVVPVRETIEGKTVWEGEVCVFRTDQGRFFAWSHEDGGKLKTVVVQGTEVIQEPADAVKAAIASQKL